MYTRQQSLHQHKLKNPQSFESRWNSSFFLFYFFISLLPGVDASHVYVLMMMMK